MQVEPRSMGVLAVSVTELHSCIGLVRTLVLRKAYVAVDAEERATHLSIVSTEVRTDVPQQRFEVPYEL